MSDLTISWLGNPAIPGGTSLSLLQALLDALHTAHDAAAVASPALALALARVAAVLENGGDAAADDAKLSADWALVRQALGDKLPPVLRPLGDTLATLCVTTVPPASAAGLLSFPLVAGDTAGAGAATLGALHFQSAASLSGQAMASVEADATAPAWAAALDYTLPPGKRFFRVGVSGAVDAGASAKATPAWGGVGVGAKGQLAAHLDYCFNYSENELVARALARSLALLPAPGNLAAMLTAFADEQCCLSSLDVLGSISVQGDLSFGKSLVATIADAGAAPAWSPAPQGGPVTAGAALAATFSAQWRLGGDYHLTVRKAAGGPIVLLDRAIKLSTASSIDLTASIGIDGVSAALAPLMTSIFPSAMPLITRLGVLGDVGGMARGALLSVLKRTAGDWAAAAQALFDVASGGGVPASAALSAAIRERLTAYAHDYLAAGTSQAQQVANDLAAVIASELQGVPHTDVLLGVLQTTFGYVQAGTKAGLATLGAALDTMIGDEVAQVAAALGVATSGFADFLKKLQTQSDSARAPLVAWLQSYERARTRLANAVGQLQSRKLSIEVAASSRHDSGRATLLELQFSQPGEAAQALYSALWTGRLEHRARLLDAAIAEGSVTLLQDLFTQTLKNASQFGFALNVFGLLSVSATATQMDKLMVRSVGENKILAISEEVDVSDTVLVNGSGSAMSLNINLEMLALADVAPPLSGQFKAAGDKLKREQVLAFFSLLEATGTVSTGTGGRVNDFLFVGAGATGANVAQASITGACVIDRQGWQTLLKVKPDDLAQRVHEACFVALEAAVWTKMEHRYLDMLPRQWLVQWLDYTGWDADEFWSRARSSVNRTSFSDDVLGTVANGNTPIAAPGPLLPIAERGSIHLLWEIAQITRGCRDAWTAVEAEAALLDDLAALPAANALATYDKLAALSKTIRTGMAKAFQYNLPDPFQPIKVSWRFLGLMMALSKAAMPNQTPAFVVNVDTLQQNEAVGKLFV